MRVHERTNDEDDSCDMSSPRRTPRTYCAVAVKVVLVMLMLQAPSFAGECFYVEVASCINIAVHTHTRS